MDVGVAAVVADFAAAEGIAAGTHDLVAVAAIPPAVSLPTLEALHLGKLQPLALAVAAVLLSDADQRAFAGVAVVTVCAGEAGYETEFAVDFG